MSEKSQNNQQTDLFLQPVYKEERDIDLLLAEEFAVSPAFARQFLSRTRKFHSSEARVIEVAISKNNYLGESDLVVVFEREDGRKFAIHIEDKINAPLQPNQVGRYHQRIDRDITSASAPYIEGEAVLCAPSAYKAVAAHVMPGETQGEDQFDSFISYEEIASFFESHSDGARARYRADFIKTAANRKINVSVPTYDEVTDRFWHEVYKLSGAYAVLEMKEVRYTAGNSWISFKPRVMSDTTLPTRIELKGKIGHVELSFSRCDAAQFAERVQHLLRDSGLRIQQVGDSTVIRVEQSYPLTISDDEASLTKARNALEAAAGLAEFYTRNKSYLDQAALDSRLEKRHR